jgi:hypothetical protein
MSVQLREPITSAAQPKLDRNLKLIFVPINADSLNQQSIAATAAS